MARGNRPNLIDDVIHQRTRLAIMATLAAVEGLEFNTLKAELGLTDGNLSTHAASLERASYVRIIKDFKGRKPRTTLAITAKGRKALRRYAESLQAILDRAGPKGAAL